MSTDLLLTTQIHTPSVPSTILGLSLFLTSLFCFLLLAIADGTWDNLRPATCLTSYYGCFCERPRNSLLRQPTNTFTNLAFTIVGTFVLIEALLQHTKFISLNQTNLKFQKLGKSETRREFELAQAFNVTFGVAGLFLGLGSGWYHASLTFIGQFIDNQGMYLVVTCPAIFSICQRYGFGAKVFLSTYVLMNGTLGYVAYNYTVIKRFVFGVTLVICLFVELYLRYGDAEISHPGKGQMKVKRNELLDTGRLKKCVGFLITAFVIWIADLTKVLCDPDSYIQGHGVWHILTAVSAFYYYAYYHPLAYFLVFNEINEKTKKTLRHEVNQKLQTCKIV